MSILRFSLLCSFLLLALTACALEPETAIPPTPTIETHAGTAVATESSDCPLPVEEEGQETAKLRLAYVTQGSLWLLDEGNEPVSLTDSGNVENVLLSPDGSRLLFSQRVAKLGVELWAVKPAFGSLFRLSTAGGIPGSIEFVSFSDDGKLMAFYRLEGADRELWVADVDGGSTRLLVSRQDLRAREGGMGDFSAFPYLVAWMPASYRLTYVPALVGQGGDSIPPPEPVLWADADTGEQGILFPEGAGGHITYSPDGRTMVIADHSRVRLRRVEDLNEPQTIAQYTPICGVPDCYIPQPVWRSDSSAFLLVLPSQGLDPDEFLAGSEGPFTIWEFSQHGSIMNELGEFFRLSTPFSISPDLKRVAYSRGGETPGLHIANIDGSKDDLVDSGQGQEFHAWAPDSLHFAYSMVLGQPLYGSICGEAIPLTDVDESEFVSWLDSTRFLMHVGPWGDWGLYLGMPGVKSTQLADFGASVIYSYVVIP